METNRYINVRLGNYTQMIDAKTFLGHLNPLWDYGNGLRAAKRLAPLDMNDWMRSSQTINMLSALIKKYGDGTLPAEFVDIEIDNKGRAKLSSIPNNPYLVTKRGKGGGTWAHLHLMLDAAAWLDADLMIDVYDSFVSSRILEWRDGSSDEFLALNAAISDYITEKDDSYGDEIASKLKIKILGSKDIEWSKATAEQLDCRTEVERQLIKLLKLKLITNFEHLKDIVDKI